MVVLCLKIRLKDILNLMKFNEKGKSKAYFNQGFLHLLTIFQVLKCFFNKELLYIPVHALKTLFDKFTSAAFIYNYNTLPNL